MPATWCHAVPDCHLPLRFLTVLESRVSPVSRRLGQRRGNWWPCTSAPAACAPPQRCPARTVKHGSALAMLQARLAHASTSQHEESQSLFRRSEGACVALVATCTQDCAALEVEDDCRTNQGFNQFGTKTAQELHEIDSPESMVTKEVQMQAGSSKYGRLRRPKILEGQQHTAAAGMPSSQHPRRKAVKEQANIRVRTCMWRMRGPRQPACLLYQPLPRTPGHLKRQPVVWDAHQS